MLAIARIGARMSSAGIQISLTCGASRFHGLGIGRSLPGFVGTPKQNWLPLWFDPSLISDFLIRQVEDPDLLGNTRQIDDLQVIRKIIFCVHIKTMDRERKSARMPILR